MDNEYFIRRLDECGDIPEIFELVKEAVRESLDRDRGGLMIGLTSLGISERGFIGAFYRVASNMIVVNKSVVERLGRIRPDLLKPYLFATLLHEYLHALGITQEIHTRAMTHQVCKEAFGLGHPVTKFSENPNFMLPEIIRMGPEGSEELRDMEFVERPDSESMGYIG